MTALPSVRIDRESPIPFYFQLKRILAQEIATGRWDSGERLPTELDICDHFDVSRTTVRQALGELESESLIVREKGRGTFVAQGSPELWFLQSSQGFYDEAVKKGHTVTSRVLRREIADLPSFAADQLGVPHGTPGLILERLRWVDGRVVMYVMNYMPAHLADSVFAADLENGSLYRTLARDERVVVGGGRRVVEAVTAEDDLATLLEVDNGVQLLYVESVTWDENLEPFEFYRAWHRADRTKVEVQVLNQQALSLAGIDPTTLRIEV